LTYVISYSQRPVKIWPHSIGQSDSFFLRTVYLHQREGVTSRSYIFQHVKET